MEFAILLLRDGRAFGFYFDWLRDEDGRELTYEDARICEWELLDRAARELYQRQLHIGREVLEGDAPAG